VPATQKQTIPVETYRGSRETILIVDDIADQRTIACQMLGKLNYNAVAVSSGEAAVEYLKTHTVDLVLLDMIMTPGIDSLETYRRITSIRPRQKAVIASGYSETKRVKAAQALDREATSENRIPWKKSVWRYRRHSPPDGSSTVPIASVLISVGVHRYRCRH
jgi:CheY-like chemotaxis protein